MSARERSANMQVFVSYARVDKAIAEALVGDLHALGHQPFYDRDLTGGQRWWETLLDQIEQCQAFLPVLSDDYRASEACHAEATWADALGVPFLPVATSQQLPGLYDPVIAEANWVQYDTESRSSLADLARALAATPPVSPPEVTPERPAIPLTYLNAIDRQIREQSEITRTQQLTFISDLRSKLGTRDEAGARELLAALRTRPEITFEAANTIDGLLGASPGPSRPAPPPTRPSPPPQRAQPASPVSPAAASAAAPAPTPTPAAPPWSEPATPPAEPPTQVLTPPPTPEHARPAGGGSGTRWLGAVLVVVGAVLAAVALAASPWVTYTLPSQGVETETGLFRGDNGIPTAVGALAVLAVVGCLALALLALLRALPTGLRIAFGAAIALVAALAVIGGNVAANDSFDSVGWGPWLLGVALVLVAVAVVVPALNATGSKAQRSRQ